MPPMPMVQQQTPRLKCEGGDEAQGCCTSLNRHEKDCVEVPALESMFASSLDCNRGVRRTRLANECGYTPFPSAPLPPYRP